MMITKSNEVIRIKMMQNSLIETGKQNSKCAVTWIAGTTDETLLDLDVIIGDRDFKL